jgi:hypothetical protein
MGCGLSRGSTGRRDRVPVGFLEESLELSFKIWQNVDQLRGRGSVEPTL